MFLIPSLAGVLLFFVLPFGMVIYYSLVNRPVNGEFIGLQNFQALLRNKALLLVTLFSPVETQSKPLSGKQRAANRILSLIFSILNLVFAITNYICHIATGMIQLYFLGVAAATVLFIAAIISRQRRRAFK